MDCININVNMGVWMVGLIQLYFSKRFFTLGVDMLQSQCKVSKKIYTTGGNGMTNDIKTIKNTYSYGRRYEEMLAYEHRFLKKWEDEVSASFRPNSTILNVGCGKGREAFCLDEKGHRVTGIDISEPVIKIAKSIAVLNNLDIDFMVSDGLNLAFPDESFDVIIIWAQTFGLFYGEHNQQHILGECKRVLKKDGILSFSVHDREVLQAICPEYLVEDYFIPYPDDNPELCYTVFTPDDLMEIAIKAEFHEIDCKKGFTGKESDGSILHCLCKK